MTRFNRFAAAYGTFMDRHVARYGIQPRDVWVAGLVLIACALI